MKEESELGDFMAEVFNEEFNLCGTTKNVLIVQMSNDQNEMNAQSTNMVVYGEKSNINDSISVYAHPMIDDFSFFPAYEMANTTDNINKETNMAILDEIFGMEHVYKHREMMSSSDMVAPNNRYTELEIIERLSSSQSALDSSADILTSAMAARKATHNRRHHIPEKKPNSRLLKSVPSKYISNRLAPPTSSSSSSPTSPSGMTRQQEEKKQMIRRVIKSELTRQGKDIVGDKELFQQIYTSVRYCYRDIVNSTVELDQEKLTVIVKMNVDFYNNMDNIARLL
ncbi:hypothetical protein [Parasitella parasitica]|uniref:Uncharacterized protein n=1 Tax=Parasitella parasitica TaxID=35722 RepID=A0A0B7NS01_9FUNG|nr:hypothetical protein [Parasitella parasitica]